MSMIDNVLERLHKVRRTGKNRWIACCPAHDDKHPSLSISIGTNDCTLIKCFAGCDVQAITDAIDIDLADLFPDKQESHSPPMRRPFSKGDVLSCCAYELLVALQIVNSFLEHNSIDESDRERLMLVAARLQAAEEIANG